MVLFIIYLFRFIIIIIIDHLLDVKKHCTVSYKIHVRQNT